MGITNYRYCDRCEKLIKELSRFKIKKTVTRVAITKIFSPDPYGYSNYDYDLCAECGNDLKKFMQREESV